MASKASFPPARAIFLIGLSTSRCKQRVGHWYIYFCFSCRAIRSPFYHIDSAALARCTALIDDRDAAATAVERMVARLLAALSRPKAAECTKGRFFDRASDKLSQLARFATNELVSVDLQAVAAALSSHG